MTTVSVALATFNGEAFIKEQLDSLAAQTCLPTELVVTDDQSTDGTVAAVEAFARTAPFPVRIHRNDANLGYKANFLRCVSLCTGDYVALCDQDDVWLPRKIERIRKLMADDVSMVFHNARVFKDGADIGELYHIEDPHAYMPEGPSFFTFAPWGLTMAFRSDLARFSHLHAVSRNPDVENVTEVHDQWFHFLATLTGNVVYAPERLVRYRQHGRNAIGWGKGKPVANLLRNMSVAVSRQRSLLACVRGRLAVIEQMGIPLVGSGAAMRDSLRAVERLLQARQSIYAAGSIGARAGSLLRLLASGQYTSKRSRFRLGYKGLAKDLAIGLLLQPCLSNVREPQARCSTCLAER